MNRNSEQINIFFKVKAINLKNLRLAKTRKKPLSKALDQMRIPTETKSYKAGMFPRNLSDLKTGQLATQWVAAAELFCKKGGEGEWKRVANMATAGSQEASFENTWIFWKENWLHNISNKLRTHCCYSKLLQYFLKTSKRKTALKKMSMPLIFTFRTNS